MMTTKTLENNNTPPKLSKILKSKNRMSKTKKSNKVWLVHPKDNNRKTLQSSFIRARTTMSPNLRTLKSLELLARVLSEKFSKSNIIRLAKFML